VCIAAKNDNVASLEMLLAARGDVNRPTTDDRSTPVYMAAQGNHAQVLKLLMKAKANVNGTLNRKQGGWTPLFVAAGFGHVNIVKLLLKHPAIHTSLVQKSVAPRNFWGFTVPAGMTPLDIAQRCKRSPVVRMLLSSAASAVSKPRKATTSASAASKHKAPASLADDAIKRMRLHSASK